MKFEDLKLDAERLCRKYGVRRLEVFGSFARGDATAESDLDLILDMDDGDGMVDRYFGILRELEAAAKRAVDVLPNKKFRNPVFARTVARDRRVIYG